MSNAEYAALKRAAAPSGEGILMFIANAALEKAGRLGGAHHQPATTGKTPSGFCFYDADVKEFAGEIPLVGRQLPKVIPAACQQGVTVDQWIADAIREKLGSRSGAAGPTPAPEAPALRPDSAHGGLEPAAASVPKPPGPESPGSATGLRPASAVASISSAKRRMNDVTAEDAHDRLELAVYAAVGAISLLSDAYWDATDTDYECLRTRASGFIGLADLASCKLQTELPLACKEWFKARKQLQRIAS